MGSRISMRIRSIGYLAIVLGVAILLWFAFKPKVIFSEQFGSHVVRITEGAEIESDGERIRIVNVSYYDPPAIMYPSRTFQCGSRTSKIAFESKQKNGLVCVYDTDDIGIVLIADQKTNDWFVTSTESDTGEVSAEKFEFWRTKYWELKTVFPDLPHEKYFLPQND
jgi:hypothetical protein